MFDHISKQRAESLNTLIPNCKLVPGSRDGAEVKALAFHHWIPGSIPEPGVISGLSLLVLYSALRGFPPGTPVFPSPQKSTFDLIVVDLI